MTILKKYSPHYRENRNADIDSIIIHYISAINVLPDDPYNVEKVLDFLTKPIPIGNGKYVRVSIHYLITRDGTIYQLVDEDSVAWHAGISSMPDGTNTNHSVNDSSIGIELIGGEWDLFTPEQYTSLIELVINIKDRHKINIKNILGHQDVSPGRKVDPGKHFDWYKLFCGLGVMEQTYCSPNNEVEPTLVNNDIPRENNITDGTDSLSQMINTIEPNKETILDKIVSFILSLIGK